MGRRFYKMSGSGNDFVFLDARHEPAGELESTEAIRAICARGTGVGADGLVVLEKGAGGDDGDVRLRYYNTDGSHAAMCGNATLCTANLAVRLGAVQPGGFTIGTDAGVVQARIRDGLPEFDLLRWTTPSRRGARKLRCGASSGWATPRSATRT